MQYIALQVLLISLVIKQLLARSSTSIRVASKKGYRVTGAIYSTTTEPRLLNCIQRCLSVAECNGVNFETDTATCEIISFDQTHTLSEELGWTLWLPENCPDVSLRPNFSNASYSVMMNLQPIVGDIMCLRDGEQTLSYLNLPAGRDTNYGIYQNKDQGSSFSKYGLDLDTLRIQTEDFRFAALYGGKMNHLSKVGRVGFCQCAADNTPYLYFDITGTSFGLEEGTQGMLVGHYNGRITANTVTDHTAVLGGTGCCGNLQLGLGCENYLDGHWREIADTCYLKLRVL